MFRHKHTALAALSQEERVAFLARKSASQRRTDSDPFAWARELRKLCVVLRKLCVVLALLLVFVLRALATFAVLVVVIKIVMFAVDVARTL